jgi:hypothetical protein
MLDAAGTVRKRSAGRNQPSGAKVTIISLTLSPLSQRLYSTRQEETVKASDQQHTNDMGDSLLLR